jgi:hypothetical protein
MPYNIEEAMRDLRRRQDDVARHHQYIANLDLAGLQAAAAEAWNALPRVHAALDTQARVVGALLSCRP